MKHEVRLFVAGTVFTEEVIARNYDEARDCLLYTSDAADEP